MDRRILTLVLLATAGCHNVDSLVDPSAPVLERADRRVTAVVRPGESIQEAVDAAEAGALIKIAPGLYRESIEVDKPGLRLVGLGRKAGRRDDAPVVIENPGGAADGIRVTESGVGFELENVTVRGFTANGVILVGVDGFRLSGVITEDNGEYGLFPVASSNGVIDGCTASGHADTGIYVGSSHDVVIRNSVAFGNVNGIEVSNSTDIAVLDNESFDNVAGILIALLPGRRVTTAANIEIARNRVHDNNRSNFATGGFEQFVPSGSGILLVGADRTVIEDNDVTGNAFVGIGVGSTLLLGALAGLPPEAFGDIDPNPDGTLVRNNVVTGNGFDPQPPVSLLLPGVDLFWDGSGTDNCWVGNVFETSFPEELPPC